MFSKVTKFSVLLIAMVVASGCSQLNRGTDIPKDISVKEKFYTASKNYRALVSLYRNSLRKQENPVVRYKLADSYYQIGDSKSSQLYLTPLLTQKLPSDLQQQVLLLSIKNSLQSKQYQQAVEKAQAMIGLYKNNAEAYNLLGIAYAKLGHFAKAKENIDTARTYFLNDAKALNNLATLEIMQGHYKEAVDLLLPQYLNNIRDERLIYNLVLALVKSGNKQYAENIVRNERLNTSPESLIEALDKAKLSTVSQK